MEKVLIENGVDIQPLDLPQARKRAISYIRFSSAQQGEHGRHSTQRQKDALEAALERWNLDLDSTFKDEGKSGYHQRHLAKGAAMYELRELAKQGQLKGKVLVFEDWDRAGRMSVTDAAPLLLDILNNGVDMVVGQDGGEYFSKVMVDANPFLFYKALDTMNRGKGESIRKVNMAKKKWQARRDAIAKGETVPLNNLPFWLVNERNAFGKCTGGYRIKDGMKQLLADIFTLYLNGDGGQIIARKLNEKGVPIPSRADGSKRKNANVWHSTFINKLLSSRAVLGYYNNTEHKVLPVMIDEETFRQANYKRLSRLHVAGRKAEHVNPYAGLFDCAHCGGHLSRHASRPISAKKRYVYLQCRSSKLGKCSAGGIDYDRFEDSFSALFGYIENWNASQVKVMSKADDVRLHIAETQGNRDAMQKAFESLPDPTKALSVATMLTNFDMKLDALKKELETEVTKDKGQQSFNGQDLIFLQSLFGNQNKLQDPATRLIIQEALRKAIGRITVDVKAKSYTVSWKNSKDVYKVQLTEQGYKITGEGCINLEFKELE